MKKLLALVILALLLACNSNKKLLQENAEKGIREFFTTYGTNDVPGTACAFDLPSLVAIDSLTQYTETEASTIVRVKCASSALPVKFLFRKNIDNKWVLASVSPVEGSRYTTGFEQMLQPYQAMNRVVQ